MHKSDVSVVQAKHSKLLNRNGREERKVNADILLVDDPPQPLPINMEGLKTVNAARISPPFGKVHNIYSKQGQKGWGMITQDY